MYRLSVHQSKSEAQKGQGRARRIIKTLILIFHLPMCGFSIYSKLGQKQCLWASILWHLLAADRWNFQKEKYLAMRKNNTLEIEHVHTCACMCTLVHACAHTHICTHKKINAILYLSWLFLIMLGLANQIEKSLI